MTTNTDFECAYMNVPDDGHVSILKICVASAQSFVVNSPMLITVGQITKGQRKNILYNDLLRIVSHGLENNPKIRIFVEAEDSEMLDLFDFD